MTTQKTLKRRVRARAAKTGESYMAARAQVLRKADASPAASEAVDSMEIAGVSDEAMVRATGRTIGEWLPILDAWGAKEHRHTEVARWLVGEYGISGWWAQNVTVAFERARGLRVRHQDPGGFSVSASKTVNVSPERVSEALADAALRARWLPDAPIRLRRATSGKSARFDWDDPPSLIGFTIFPKGEGKSQVGLGHEKLPDAETAERLKLMWRERLGALKQLLEQS